MIAMALAVTLSVTSVFTGASKHKHYGVNVVPQCFTTGCVNATTVAVQVTTGKARHPAAKCVYGTFQLPNAKIHRNGTFMARGDGSTVSKRFKLQVSGVFTSPRNVHGTVIGPKVCGGSDTFRLKASPALAS